jgi:hypothetical protein
MALLIFFFIGASDGHQHFLSYFLPKLHPKRLIIAIHIVRIWLNGMFCRFMLHPLPVLKNETRSIRVNRMAWMTKGPLWVLECLVHGLRKTAATIGIPIIQIQASATIQFGMAFGPLFTGSVSTRMDAKTPIAHSATRMVKMIKFMAVISSFLSADTRNSCSSHP